MVGVGKRVLQAVIPALCACPECFELVSLHGRRARTIDACGKTWSVDPLTSRKSLDGIDLVYLAVGKAAVPEVLRQLCEMGAADTRLLIDTPVLRFRDFRHTSLLSEFKQVGVPEDCAYLPWIEPVRACVSAGELGEVSEWVLWKSAYAYHGVATAKSLLGAQQVQRGKRTHIDDGLCERRLQFKGGGRATLIEPRDYATGWIQVIGSESSLCDRPREGAGGLTLEAIEHSGLVRAVRVGDHHATLDEAEASLTAGDPGGTTLIARQAAMKRVGLLRILREVHAGGVGYPLDAGIEDMVVDYWLERAGVYWATPFTQPKAPLARMLYNGLSRLGG